MYSVCGQRASHCYNPSVYSVCGQRASHCVRILVCIRYVDSVLLTVLGS